MAGEYADDVKGLTDRLKSAKTPAEREQLWQELFPRLHRVARNRIRAVGREGRESSTDLINELYPALQRALDRPNTRFANRAQFLAYAATAMRREIARRAKAALVEELLQDDFSVDQASPAMAIAMSEGLDQLAAEIPRAVRAYHLREYGGYSYTEIIELMSDQYNGKALLAADLTLVRTRLANLLRPLE